VRAHTATLSQGLVELENDAANPQRIEPLMRAAHSVKGAARIVNLEAAVRLAHVMEDVLVAAQHARIRLGPGEIDLLLQGTDLLGGLSQISEATAANWSSAHDAEIAALSERLKAIEQGAQVVQSDGEIPAPAKEPVPPAPSPVPEFFIPREP